MGGCWPTSWGLSREWALGTWNEGTPGSGPGEPLLPLRPPGGGGGLPAANKHLLIIPIRDEFKLKGNGHRRKTSPGLTGAPWGSLAGAHATLHHPRPHSPISELRTRGRQGAGSALWMTGRTPNVQQGMPPQPPSPKKRVQQIGLAPASLPSLAEARGASREPGAKKAGCGFQRVHFSLRGTACLEKGPTCPEEALRGSRAGGLDLSIQDLEPPWQASGLSGTSGRNWVPGIPTQHPVSPSGPTEECASLQRPDRLHTQRNCG